jgi:hypothetical protein
VLAVKAPLWALVAGQGPCYQDRQAFGEDTARAAGLRAAEAADLKGQRDDAAHHGKVGDMADVPAVDPSRRYVADRTASDQVGRSGMHGNELGTQARRGNK